MGSGGFGLRGSGRLRSHLIGIRIGITIGTYPRQSRRPIRLVRLDRSLSLFA